MNLRQALILVSTWLMVVFNLFSQQFNQYLFGVSTDGYGKYYESMTMISPVEYTFLIWAPIFIGMLAFSIFQSLPKNKNSKLLDKLLLPVLLINVCNSMSQYTSFGWNILVVIGLLIGLVIAFVVIQRFKQISVISFWYVEFPLSIFFGWITIALVVATSQNLVYFKWDAFGLPDEVWACLMITVAAIIGFIIFKNYKSYVYSFVLIWALLGIIINNYPQNPIILCVAPILILVLLYQVLLKDNRLESIKWLNP